MKKTKYTFIIIFVLISIVYFGFKDKESQTTYNSLPTLDSKTLDANSIRAWFRNNGSFNRDPFTGNSGFEWLKGTNKFARYASGFWLGAKIGNDTFITTIEYSYEFLPGYTNNNGVPQGKDAPLYRIYKLTYDITDPDRLNWPNILLGNSDQGAPVYWDTQTNSWKPLDYGSQTMFYVMTDSYPESHINNSGGSLPMKADVKQLNFSFNVTGTLNNVIYQQYTIINRNNIAWNDFYFAIWTDDDLGDATDDRVGCDTNFNMGYTYNADNDDPVYGVAPPAVAFILLKGPDVYTGNNNDTSSICLGKEKRVRTGYKSQKMTAFIGDPTTSNKRETYRLMSGFDRYGNPIINPVTNQITKFMYSGDPVTNTGWVQSGANDRRFLTSVGPVNMNPNDTQVIVVAQLISRGNSNLNSITKLREDAVEVINKFKECFGSVPIGITSNTNESPDVFRLYQNYPNPFNPSTKIRFSTPLNPLFIKGGTVRSTGGFITLKIYDVLGREVSTLVNDKLKPGTYEVEFDGSGFSSGVYYYELSVGDYKETKRMVLLK